MLLLFFPLALAVDVEWEAPDGWDGRSPFRDICFEDGDCGWENLSDGILYGSMGLGLATATLYTLTPGPGVPRGRIGDNWSAEPAVSYLVGGAVTLGIQRWTKANVARPRPYTGSEAYDDYDEFLLGDGEHSFFSGHTAITAFSLFYSASAYDLYSVPTEQKPGLSALAYTFATAGTFLVGKARVEAGMHYWSDVTVGAFFGAAMGIASPRVGQLVPDRWGGPMRVEVVPGGVAFNGEW